MFSNILFYACFIERIRKLGTTKDGARNTGAAISKLSHILKCGICSHAPESVASNKHIATYIFKKRRNLQPTTRGVLPCIVCQYQPCFQDWLQPL